MKNDRLFGIIYLLLTKQTVTAQELADYFGVSVRTIYRDIDLLSAQNIPIYATKGKNGGIGLLENYKLDKSLLSEEEQNQILFALQSLEKLSQSEDENVFHKMRLLFQKESHDWIDIDFTVWGKDTFQKNLFEMIKTAILSHKKLEFVYYNSYGKTAKRVVEPLQICFKYKSWYVFSYDSEKLDYRLFKLTRMKDCQILDESFERELPQKQEQEKYPEPDIKLITVQLEIAKEAAYRVFDEFPSDLITPTEDGNFIVTVTYPESEWVYGYILSYGMYAKVLGPDNFKQEIKRRLEESIQNYL
ncbi:MAG: YafY family transcriptional regulator [Firmicutes bacterium]|nr:YafY family transcriptional regulator [Bacillota bacterium]